MVRHVAVCLLLASAACASADLASNDAGLGTDADPNAPDANASCDPLPAGWSELGSDLTPDPAQDSWYASVAIDSSNAPVVAVTGGSPAQVEVKRWTGSAWQALGSPQSANPGTSTHTYSPVLRKWGSGLVVGFVEPGSDDGYGYYVRRWNGTDWAVMGGGNIATSHALTGGHSDIFVVDDEHLVVAWSQYSEGYIGRSRVQVRRFTGDAYVPVTPEQGGIAGPGADAISPRIALDATGQEVVLFSESRVRSFRRNGADTAWEALGTGEVSPAASEYGGHSPNLAVDSLGRLVVAMAEYDEAANVNKVWVTRWHNGQWTTLGAIDALPGTESHGYPQAIVIDAEDRPIVAFTEPADFSSPSRLFVARYNGTSFDMLGGQAITAYTGLGSIIAPSLAVDECGAILLGFSESAGSGAKFTTHVYRFGE